MAKDVTVRKKLSFYMDIVITLIGKTIIVYYKNRGYVDYL